MISSKPQTPPPFRQDQDQEQRSQPLQQAEVSQELIREVYICQGLAIDRVDDCSGWMGHRYKQFHFVVGPRLVVS